MIIPIFKERVKSGLCTPPRREITVTGRLLSGVHWFTDILGGLLCGAAMVLIFYALSEKLSLRQAAGRAARRAGA